MACLSNAALVMRIRQVRPEFFSDPVVGRLSPDARLTYIGLWCIADDAGWLDWDPEHIAAMLSPYESVRVRTARMEKAAEALVASGRVILHDCGHAQIPTLQAHQRIGGNKSFLTRDRHESIHVRTSTPVGRYVGREVGNSRERATNDEDQRAAFRRLGLPVDAA